MQASRTLHVSDARFQKALEKEGTLLFEGAMGTMLFKAGLAGGELPDLCCLSHPDTVADIHRQYAEAGADIAITNTFGSNADKLGDKATVAEVFNAATDCARKGGAPYVAGDIGPTGQMLEPFGALSEEHAYDLFAEEARSAETAGCDLVLIETMADLAEAKIAARAALETTELPVFVTMTFDASGHTLMGNTPAQAAEELAKLGVQVVGINCSLGPSAIRPFTADMLEHVSCPVMTQPNAGLPSMVDGREVYPLDAETFAQEIAPMLDDGVRIIGSCCGSTPEFTAALRALLDQRQ